MNKNFYIIVMLVFGFLGMTSTVFACGKNNSNTDSCKKEVSSKQEAKDCCDTQSNTNGKPHDGCGSCGGKCGHTNCNIHVVQTALFVPFYDEVSTKSLFFYTKKEKIYILETAISSGFQSLWLIPKIG